ncbi:MAG: molybdenum cofactor biosynthesis protein B [Anaerolineales bacterium]
MKIRAAVITVSDKGSRGEREDVSGPLLASRLEEIGAEVVEQFILPDEPDQIAAALMELADSGEIDLIMTSGGTGAAPRDRTPEATLEVIDRRMPGLAEILRLEGYKKTPFAVLSRGVAGLYKGCLIVNLPGNPNAVRDDMDILESLLPHAIQMAKGEHLEHESEEDEG